MDIRKLSHQTGKMITDNSPAILTAIGVTGLVATAYLTGKATFKAADLLENERYTRSINRTGVGDSPMSIDNKERIKLVWKHYIPALAVGSLSAAAIIGANRVGTRRAAAVTAAYAISERAYSEYKDKVVEQIGKTKEQKVRDEIAQDRVKALPANQQVIITGKGDQLFMDAYSGRTFISTMEDVKQAQNAVNHQVLSQQYASLSDLYNQLGLSNTKVSDDVGWNSDKLMEMTFSTTFTDDMKSCIVMDFNVAPVRNFFRSH